MRINPSVSDTRSDADRNLTVSTLLSLLESADREIETYRRRQISTFRELAIVQALITWGVGQLGFVGKALAFPRACASGACILATFIGCWLILVFKKRIHYVRDKKTDLQEEIKRFVSLESVQTSYPTKNRRSRFNAMYETVPSSSIYIYALITVGALTAVTNFYDFLSILRKAGGF